VREPAKPWVTDVGENVTVDDPQFLNPTTGAYRAPAGLTFTPILVDQIGPRKP
jgi:hypothetical protein